MSLRYIPITQQEPLVAAPAALLFHAPCGSKIKALAFHPVRARLLLTDEKGRVFCYDYKSGHVLFSFHPDELPPSPDDSHGSSAGMLRHLSFFDEATVAASCRPHSHRGRGDSLHGGRRLSSAPPTNWAVAVCEHRVALVDQRLGASHVHSIASDPDLDSASPTCAVAVSHRLLAVACSDGAIRIWDCVTRQRVRVLRPGSKEQGGGGAKSGDGERSGERGAVTHLANAHPQGSCGSNSGIGSKTEPDSEGLEDGRVRFVSVSADGSVRLWCLRVSTGITVAGGEPVKLGFAVGVHKTAGGGSGEGSVASVSYDACGDRLAVHTRDGRLTTWDLAASRTLELEQHDDAPTPAAASKTATKAGNKGSAAAAAAVAATTANKSPFFATRRFPPVLLGGSNTGSTPLSTKSSSKAGSGAAAEKAGFAVLVRSGGLLTGGAGGGAGSVGGQCCVAAAGKAGSLELFATSHLAAASGPSSSSGLLMPLAFVDLRRLLATSPALSHLVHASAARASASAAANAASAAAAQGGATASTNGEGGTSSTSASAAAAAAAAAVTTPSSLASAVAALRVNLLVPHPNTPLLVAVATSLGVLVVELGARAAAGGGQNLGFASHPRWSTPRFFGGGFSLPPLPSSLPSPSPAPALLSSSPRREGEGDAAALAVDDDGGDGDGGGDGACLLPTAQQCTRRVLRVETSDNSLWVADLVPSLASSDGSSGGGSGGGGGRAHDITCRDVSKVLLDRPLFPTPFVPADGLGARGAGGAPHVPLHNAAAAAENDDDSQAPPPPKSLNQKNKQAKAVVSGQQAQKQFLGLSPVVLASPRGDLVALHWPFTGVFQVYRVAFVPPPTSAASARRQSQEPDQPQQQQQQEQGSRRRAGRFVGVEVLRGRALSVAWTTAVPLAVPPGDGLSAGRGGGAGGKAVLGGRRTEAAAATKKTNAAAVEPLVKRDELFFCVLEEEPSEAAVALAAKQEQERLQQLAANRPRRRSLTLTGSGKSTEQQQSDQQEKELSPVQQVIRLFRVPPMPASLFGARRGTGGVADDEDEDEGASVLEWAHAACHEPCPTATPPSSLPPTAAAVAPSSSVGGFSGFGGGGGGGRGFLLEVGRYRPLVPRTGLVAEGLRGGGPLLCVNFAVPPSNSLLAAAAAGGGGGGGASSLDAGSGAAAAAIAVASVPAVSAFYSIELKAGAAGESRQQPQGGSGNARFGAEATLRPIAAAGGSRAITLPPATAVIWNVPWRWGVDGGDDEGDGNDDTTTTSRSSRNNDDGAYEEEGMDDEAEDDEENEEGDLCAFICPAGTFLFSCSLPEPQEAATAASFPTTLHHRPPQPRLVLEAASTRAAAHFCDGAVSGCWVGARTLLWHHGGGQGGGALWVVQLPSFSHLGNTKRGNASCDECPVALVASNDPAVAVAAEAGPRAHQGAGCAGSWSGNGVVVAQRLPAGPLAVLGVVCGLAVVAPLENMRSQIAPGVDRRVCALNIPLVF